MHGQGEQVHFQSPVLFGVDAYRGVPAAIRPHAAPDAVPVKAEGSTAKVPQRRFPPENRMRPRRHEQNECSLVPQVMDVAAPGLLPPRPCPLAHVDAVLPDELAVYVRRILVQGHAAADVSPEARRHVVGELLDERLTADGDTTVLHTAVMPSRVGVVSQREGTTPEAQ